MKSSHQLTSGEIYHDEKQKLTFFKDIKHVAQVNPNHVSFSAYNPKTSAGSASLRGRAGEDRVDDGFLSEIKPLEKYPDDIRDAAMKEIFVAVSEKLNAEIKREIFEKLNKDIKDEYDLRDVGSTATITIPLGDKVYNLTTGDSLGFMVEIDEKNQVTVSCLSSACFNVAHLLQTEYEKLTPEEKKERDRLRGHHNGTTADYKKILSGYLRLGNLAMSRSFGDFTSEGVICTPACAAQNIHPNRFSIVFNVSDGATDAFKTEAEWKEVIEQFIQRKDFSKQAFNPAMFAMHIALSAKNKLMETKAYGIDDISVAAMMINKHTSGTYISVYDGHAGNEVSDYLQTHLPRVFQTIAPAIVQKYIERSAEKHCSLVCGCM